MWVSEESAAKALRLAAACLALAALSAFALTLVRVADWVGEMLRFYL